MFEPDEPSVLRAEIRKRSKDRELTRVLLAAVDAGAPGKLTHYGIAFAGPEGETAGTHWTLSDYRGVRNVAGQLRRIGIDIPRVRESAGKTTHKAAVQDPRYAGRRGPAAPYEAPRREVTTYTYVPPPPPPEPEPEPVRLPPALAKLPDRVLVHALRLAGGDMRRLWTDGDGAVVVANRRVW